jgi:phosphonate transport system substrate-binding protein
VLSALGQATQRATARFAGPSRGRLSTFCDALSLAVDYDVTPYPCESYADLLAELHWGTVNLAWLPPMLALRAMGRSGATPLAAPVRAGSAWYWSALFAAGDARAECVGDLKRARVAWVDHMSSGGYLVIRASLRAQGLQLDNVFGHEQFLGTHDAVVQAVLQHEVDVGATFAHFDDAGRVRNAGWGRAPVKVLKFAGPIPADVLAAGKELPAELSAAVSDALVGDGHGDVQRSASSLFNATGFESVTREHLSHLEELLQYVEIPSSPSASSM